MTQKSTHWIGGPTSADQRPSDCSRGADKLAGGNATSATPGSFLDFTEAAANAVIGLVVSWLATLFVLGFSPAQSAAITGMFFGLSFSRAWIIRRIFRGLQNV
ncbi:MAG: DUF7220 family protein [Pikeienuella sp.]